MRLLVRALLAASCLLPAAPAHAQNAGAPTVVEVRVEQEGQAVTDRLITGLIETRVGEPLSMRSVRETTTHLMSLRPIRGRAVVPGAGARQASAFATSSFPSIPWTASSSAARSGSPKATCAVC